MFIISGNGYWMVGDITSDSGWLISEERGLLTPPRTGWQYADGNCGEACWFSDDTLVFNYCDGEETMTRECYSYGEWRLTFIGIIDC